MLTHDPLSDSADADWLVGVTELDVDVAWLVHAVGSGQDDVFVEDGSSTEPSVLFIQEESLKTTRRDREGKY